MWSELFVLLALRPAIVDFVSVKESNLLLIFKFFKFSSFCFLMKAKSTIEQQKVQGHEKRG